MTNTTKTNKKRYFLKLSAPIFASMLSINLMNLVDVAMVSKLGTNAVAATGYCFFLFWLAHSFFVGVGSAVQTYTARYFGHEPNKQYNPLQIGLFIAFSLGLIITIATLLTSTQLFQFFVFDEQVRTLTKDYFDIRIIGLVALSFNIIYRAFYNGSQKPHIYLYVIIVMHIINIILNYALIFGNLGFERMDIEGAALASTIALYIGSILYTLMIITEHRTLGLFQLRSIKDEFKKVWQLSLPLGLQELSFSSSFTTFTWVIGMIGATQVAIANVIVTLIIFIWNLCYSVSVSTQSLISEAISLKDKLLQNDWIKTAKIVGVSAVLSMSTLVVIFHNPILALFFDDIAIINEARKPLLIDTAVMWVECIGLIYMGALQGIGAGKEILAVRLFIQWGCLVPLSYIVVAFFSGTITQLWILVAVLTITKTLIMRQVWKQKSATQTF